MPVTNVLNPKELLKKSVNSNTTFGNFNLANNFFHNGGDFS